MNEKKKKIMQTNRTSETSAKRNKQTNKQTKPNAK